MSNFFKKKIMTLKNKLIFNYFDLSIIRNSNNIKYKICLIVKLIKLKINIFFLIVYLKKKVKKSFGSFSSSALNQLMILQYFFLCHS